MTLGLYFSNRVERLSEELMAQMLTTPLDDPLAADFVLVDNLVMGQWLNLQIAGQQGIAANIRYIQPHELFWKLARELVSADIPELTPLSKQEMTWRLYSLFSNEDFLLSPALLPVRDYLADTATVALRRYQLSAAVADLFDQYLVYRPEWMLHWAEGQQHGVNEKPALMDAGIDGNENVVWQSFLWRKLNEMIGDDGCAFRHRAMIEKKLLEVLGKKTPSDIAGRMTLKRLYVFGVTTMPVNMVAMLHSLSHHIEVNLFVPNPCQEYWSLISPAKTIARQQKQDADETYYEIGNPLLASLGIQVRDFISLLQKLPDENLQETSLFEAVEPVSLLRAIQHEILELTYKGESASVDFVAEGIKQKIPCGDVDADGIPSLHIHSCHSVMREVEVLHDQIRDMMHRHPDICPRDIVVMMPRVAPYVACIHAVFNSVEERQRIDYQIADRTQGEESPLLNSFETLLQLPDSRLTLTEIISLLEVPAVQRRFSIDASGYETLKRWLVESGVRWGRDARHREKSGLPAYHEASWQYAFDRFFSGYSMSANHLDIESLLTMENGCELMPLDLVEGGNTQYLDAFLQFWTVLKKWSEKMNEEATAVVWLQRLSDLIEDFFDPVDDQEIMAIRAIHKEIQSLENVEQCQWFTACIPLAVIRDLVKPALKRLANGHHHWGEGVKFCSLMPMRGVPFKVVYVMGMNQDDYPRRIERRGFDLMRKNYRPGDRAGRIDDRWLFLEALLSARQFFHVSYIGRDMHRNEKCEPSVVLAELIDYCRHGYYVDDGNVLDCLITEHPLQPFSPCYFRKDRQALSSRLISFNEQARKIVDVRQRQNQETNKPAMRWMKETVNTKQQTETRIVDLDTFIRFFTRPWSWFLEKKNSVWLEIEEEHIDDNENFGKPDGLFDWEIHQDLIALASRHEKKPENIEAETARLLEELVRLRSSEGKWPLGFAGRNKTAELMKKLKNADFYWLSCGKSLVRQPFSVHIKGSRSSLCIQGFLPVSSDAEIFLHSASKLNEDRQIDFEIKAALAKKCGLQKNGKKTETAKAFFRENKKALTIEFNKIDDAANESFLRGLVDLYCKFQATGLPFEPALSRKVSVFEKPAQCKSIIDDAWYENNRWTQGIAQDSQKRAYF
ncbi:MAG: exodeoxyribonuclease V subunit gamma, partial [Pseudomonadales bacterium]|nr:exodeoxyribonuclease V subunit gamma [Pseudomonadales bacterium]